MRAAGDSKRFRTRRRLLESAARLIAEGRTPSTSEVAEAAGVSRRTAYRYFPTQEQLLVEAALEDLRPRVEAAVQAVNIVRAGKCEDDLAWALARLDATVHIMHE